MPIKLVDVAELPVDAKFVDLPDVDGDPVRWVRHSGLPQSSLERRVTRPRLSRYRAAWNAAAAARDAEAIISHLPNVTAAVSDFGVLTGMRAPHLAFSFNFTDLPGAAKRLRFSTSLARVAQFAVYTEYEAALYADYFGLPPERFRPLLWTQETPTIGVVDPALVPSEPFVAAVGGEGRDFAVLTAAAKALPEVPFIVIARPTGALRDPPPNMKVHFNLPAPQTWALASRAAGMLAPLRTDETCCGHITLVSGRMLGIPMITTRSRGTREYSEGFAGTQLVPASDTEALVAAISSLIEDPTPARAAAAGEVAEAAIRHERTRWAEYIADFIRQTR